MNAQQPTRLRPFKPLPFGRYTLLSPLAVGGMGEIYLARLDGAKRFERLCVIKKILPFMATDRDFLERFLNEARTLARLQHPSIAQVLDMGLVQGEPYLALEYVDGKDVRKLAARALEQKSSLPLTFSLYVMGRVLDALAYVHRKRDEDDGELNLVHRDISPQNILISYEGEVKVIDFGLAKSSLSQASTQPNIIVGKFLYMSPEQVRHQPVDRRSDLYSAGLCLYELIAGKSPFEHISSGELLERLKNPSIAPLHEVAPQCPMAVCELVMKAVAPEPDDRFQTAEEFRGKVMAALVEMDPFAGPESVSTAMREAFANEYQAERILLATLQESQPESADDSMETAVYASVSGHPGLHAVPPVDGDVDPAEMPTELNVPTIGDDEVPSVSAPYFTSGYGAGYSARRRSQRTRTPAAHRQTLERPRADWTTLTAMPARRARSIPEQWRKPLALGFSGLLVLALVVADTLRGGKAVQAAEPQALAAAQNEPPRPMGPVGATGLPFPYSEAVDDIIVPLAPVREKVPAKKAKSAKPAKRGPAFEKEWSSLRSHFEELERQQGCEVGPAKLLCSRFRSLREEVAAASGDALRQERLLPKVRSLAQAAQLKKGS
jgi:serine/threonine protein kinase